MDATIDPRKDARLAEAARRHGAIAAAQAVALPAGALEYDACEPVAGGRRIGGMQELGMMAEAALLGSLLALSYAAAMLHVLG